MHPSGCKCHFDCGLPHQSWTGGGWKGCFVWSFEHREGRNWMFPHFCSNQLLRSCHDRRQTIISLFNDNYFCQCYLQLLDDVYYHRYLQLIIMMIIIIIFFKCLFWLLINTRRIETYHLWILSLYMNSRHQTLYVSWLWTAQDRNLHADLLLKCIQETPSCDPMVCLSWLWFLLLLRDGYSPYLLL